MKLRTLIAGLILALAVVAPALADQSTQPADSSASPMIAKDGVLLLNGKPFIKRAGWFGVNHWLSNDLQKTRGHFMSIPFDAVGTQDDYYTGVGFNVAFFSGQAMSTKDKGFDFSLVDELAARARKAGLEMSFNIDLEVPRWMAEEAGWYWINEDGEKVPIEDGRIHYNPEEYKRVMRKFLTPEIEHIRNFDNLIDYQISGETHAYSQYHSRQSGDISYDSWSLDHFRQYLTKRYSLEQISMRYGNRLDFYKSIDDVYPPKSGGYWFDDKGLRHLGVDFKGRGLLNWGVARWDWVQIQKGRRSGLFRGAGRADKGARRQGQTDQL